MKAPDIDKVYKTARKIAATTSGRDSAEAIVWDNINKAKSAKRRLYWSMVRVALDSPNLFAKKNPRRKSTTRKLRARAKLRKLFPRIAKRHMKKNPRTRAFLHVAKTVHRKKYIVQVTMSGEWKTVFKSPSKSSALDIAKRWHRETGRAVKVYFA